MVIFNITASDFVLISLKITTILKEIDYYHDQWNSGNTDAADGSSLGAVSYDTKWRNEDCATAFLKLTDFRR